MKKLLALLIALAPVLLVASYVHTTIVRSNKEPRKKDTTAVLRQPERTRFGVFVTNEMGQQTPLRISSMNATTDIRGTLATTTLEIVVYNPNDRTLEGQFSFPVSDGQTVSRFALDLNGKLRDAVVVDKSKARATFEAIQRRGVDPALLEWTRDNAFRTRIYPIMPRSTRRILIAYEQDLTQGEDGLQYTLPIAVDDTVGTFKWDVSVAAFGMKPQLSGNSADSISFSNRGRTFVSTVSRTNFLITQPFVIDVPVVPAAHVVTVNEHGTETFASIVVASPNTTATSTERPLARKVTIAWDASLSGARRNHEKELQFFDAYFAKNANVDVQLHVFAHETIRDQRYVVKGGNWSELRNTLLNMTYDGATQLGAVPLSTFRSDLVFLVTDGVSTFGEHQPTIGTTPVVGLVTSAFADIDHLRALCEGTGGEVYDLRVTSIKDALSSVFTTRLMLESVKVVGGAMTSIYPQGMVDARLCNTIVGTLQSPTAELELVYSLNGVLVEKKTIVVNTLEHKVDGLSAARQWAQYELKTMAGDRRARAHDITQLGMRFGIVTPGTSLLVLETLNDYVQYDIEPPATEPELLAQWTEQKKNNPVVKVQSAEARHALLETLVNGWKSWYLKPLPEQRSPDTAVRVVPVDPQVQITAPRAGLGAITGLVRDTSGRVVPGATIRVLGTTRGGITKTNGEFLVKNINPGAYSVRATAVGYDTASQSVVLSADQTNVVNFAVTPADVRMKMIEVAADPVVVRSTDIGTTRVLKGSDMTRVARDNTASALSLNAGIRASGNNFVVRGSRATEDQVLVDGLAVTDQFTGGLGSSGEGSVAPTTLARNAPLLERSEKATIVSRDVWTSALQTCSKDSVYSWYLGHRAEYGRNVGYYLDVSDVLREKGLTTASLRVLSNLAELEGENHQMLRILARRLLQLGKADYAVEVFKDVRDIRDEEPQSYRDLALALDASGKHQQAVEMLYAMATRTWDGRFPEVELIALNEMNHIIGLHPKSVDVSKIPPSMLYSVASDIRVVMDWDSDNCDIDLWVTDPQSVKCYYGHRFPRSGGRLSRDLTGGYGPEEFMIKDAPKGTFKIEANYFGDRQQRLSGPTTVQVTVYRNYGRPNEQRTNSTVRLTGVARVVDLAQVKVD
ncbi:MAG: carboxypeptidase regulatory-like domain-containing protein [Ignavibacteria bacterium]|nr:carboxypeptidase regulatory-like domain-containing protein [Ignavibacteria bacterium]